MASTSARQALTMRDDITLSYANVEDRPMGPDTQPRRKRRLTAPAHFHPHSLESLVHKKTKVDSTVSHDVEVHTVEEELDGAFLSGDLCSHPD